MTGVARDSAISLQRQEAPALTRKGFCKVNRSAAGMRQEGALAGSFLHAHEADASGVCPWASSPARYQPP